MTIASLWSWLLSAAPGLALVPAPQGQTGSIRGVVLDQDFDAPLAAALVTAVETGQTATTTDQGSYVLNQVPPGRYTLVFSKEGYVRQVRTDVVVGAGRMTEVNAALSGDFTDMEEFVVQDLLLLNPGSEAALLELRFSSPSFMDSIGSDLMNQAGASDAAGALRLVAGASLQDGRTAVIRGLPDRYVSTQLNGVRLPSADEDKRAVELDQFPATVIESVQVSKTFTPDQQGDASGGAVNIRLKGIPDDTSLNVRAQYSANSQVSAAGDDFLTSQGGGVRFLGRDDGRRDQQLDRLGQNWLGAVGTSTGDMPLDYKFSASGGHKHTFKNDITIGGYANLFYDRTSSYFDNGVSDSWWVETPGEAMTPETIQGGPLSGDFKTRLFDVTRGTQTVSLGGLGAFGVRSKHHEVNLAYLYTRNTQDAATLATDTRGKEYFFPGYDPNDVTSEGNLPANRFAAPYIRLETLEYTERTTGTLVLSGKHTLPIRKSDIDRGIGFKAPELDWQVSSATSDLNQPDKRIFGAFWIPAVLFPGAPPFLPPFKTEPTWYPFKPADNFNLGNLQRIWKEIDEQSSQYSFNLKLPFEQWTQDTGYLKLGLFGDRVKRNFNQDTFSNFGDSGASFQGGWDMPWSEFFPGGTLITPSGFHPITESLFDVDYKGRQEISAWYAMMELPLVSNFRVVGGARSESTYLSTVNEPEEGAIWFPPGSVSPAALTPGAADVDFQKDALLPAIGIAYDPFDQVTLRASYSETVARQTFKEITPIVQQEYAGAPIFIGNPELGMSELQNYDLRLDYRPYRGSLLSLSWFYKDITDPIEYVQRLAGFNFTTARNYPKGTIQGWELEARQDLGLLWDPLRNLSVGANATFLDSIVYLPEDEIEEFELPNIQAPMESRDMTNAPDQLFNFYVTYEIPVTGTQMAVFYTVQGDTLIAGAGQSNGNYVPNVYATQFETLNVSLTQRLGPIFRLQVQGKNLTNPTFQTVYRSEYIGEDVLRTSFTSGIALSVSLSAAFSI